MQSIGALPLCHSTAPPLHPRPSATPRSPSLGPAMWTQPLPKPKSTETHILEQPKTNQNHHRNPPMFSLPHNTFLWPPESRPHLRRRPPSSIHRRSDLRSSSGSHGSLGHSPDFSRSPTVTLSLDLHLL
jgi:hypothetical protein